MKKRLLTAVLLLVCMVFNVFLATSCGGGASELDAFETAIENTAPTNVDGKITLYTGSATLELEFSSVIAEDGTFTSNYRFSNLNDISSGGANDLQSNVEGTVTYDGTKYSDDSIAGKITAAATQLDIGASMEYNVNSDGKILTATVAAEDTEDVFGTDYATDVRFVLTQADEKIISLVLEYTLQSGELVKAECFYK